MSLINYLEDATIESLTAVRGEQYSKSADIREMHIGLVNLMPDSAYFQTIRDWAQLINLADQSLHIYLEYINLDGVEREGEMLEHASRYGKSVDDALAEGLDAVIVTGANTEFDYDDIREVPYIDDFRKIVRAIDEGPITSGIFSCFSFHLLMLDKYGVSRNLYDPEQGDSKVWGVHEHVVPVESREHYLTRGGDTSFMAVNSRWGDIDAEQASGAGLTVLNYADTELRSIGAVTDDKMNYLGLQTHSEYDMYGLLKEYLRDWNLHQGGELAEPDKPTFLTGRGMVMLEELVSKGRVESADRKVFYGVIGPEIKMNWKSYGISLIHRWVSGVLKLTGYGRSQKYTDGVDPEQPLKYLRGEQ